MSHVGVRVQLTCQLPQFNRSHFHEYDSARLSPQIATIALVQIDEVWELRAAKDGPEALCVKHHVEIARGADE